MSSPSRRRWVWVGVLATIVLVQWATARMPTGDAEREANMVRVPIYIGVLLVALLVGASTYVAGRRELALREGRDPNKAARAAWWVASFGVILGMASMCLVSAVVSGGSR